MERHLLMLIAQVDTSLKHIDATASLIQSHGWGLTAIALIVTLMLVLFAINMIDARRREQRYVEENLGREKDMKDRIRTMEDRQYAEMKGLVTGYHQALTEQTTVCRELSVVLNATKDELEVFRQLRESAPHNHNAKREQA
jgi:uncharacterized membrane-anchored protein YhcB (DUF1043 family)